MEPNRTLFFIQGRYMQVRINGKKKKKERKRKNTKGRNQYQIMRGCAFCSFRAPSTEQLPMSTSPEAADNVTLLARRVLVMTER